MGLALVESVIAHVRFVLENNISEFYRCVSKKERSIQSQSCSGDQDAQHHILYAKG